MDEAEWEEPVAAVEEEPVAAVEEESDVAEGTEADEVAEAGEVAGAVVVSMDSLPLCVRSSIAGAGDLPRESWVMREHSNLDATNDFTLPLSKAVTLFLPLTAAALASAAALVPVAALASDEYDFF